MPHRKSGSILCADKGVSGADCDLWKWTIAFGGTYSYG